VHNVRSTQTIRARRRLQQPGESAGWGEAALRLTKGQSLAVALLAQASPLPLFGVRLRGFHLEATATRLSFATIGVIGSGILASILTTPDPLWWQLHFSRLGTFSAFSSYAFNLTIIISGMLVMLFGLRLRVEMARHAGTAVLVSRRGAVIVPVLVVVIGAHLSLIGLVPVNTNEFLHDRGSIGALLCFSTILATSRWMLRGMHRVIARMTRRVGIALAVSTAAFIPGFINLAAFELVVFGLMFAWFLCLARTIGRPDDERPHSRPALSRRTGVRRTAVIAPPVPATHVPVATRGPLATNARVRAATRPRRSQRARRRTNRGVRTRQPDPEHRRATSQRPQAGQR